MLELFVVAGLSFFHPRQDSIGMETINGKMFIIHKVDEKETLYAISRRYGVTVNQILDHNPGADGGLEINQILKVPYVPRPKSVPGGTVHKVAEKETLYSISRLYNVTVEEIRSWNSLPDYSLSVGQELAIRGSNTVPPTTLPVSAETSRDVHTVAAKETLFSIARQYGVTVNQIREWNSLVSEELKIGQVLIVSAKSTNTSTPVDPPVQIAVVKENPVIAESREVTPSITISESVKDKDEVRQSGLAELIEGTEGNRKYLALHRTAPVGTILKVKNEMNNREVFVRVAGKLPETAFTDKLLIKISRSAYDKLGAIDPRFRVEVTYYK